MVLVFTVLFYICNLLLLSGFWYAWRAGKKESFIKQCFSYMLALYSFSSAAGRLEKTVLRIPGCTPTGF